MRRRYKVAGDQHAVFDKPPGTIFEADLEPAQEERLIRRGALILMPPARAPKPSPDEAATTKEEEGDG